MERVLNLAGKNSSEIFQLRYPFSLLTFCDYDLSYFAENAVAVCDEALRSGELDADRVTDLRNSLRNMHVYIEHNLRTVYDKIVLDCWIDYVCRRDNIGTTGLWNRFIDCRTAFEKAVFVRLCEYRYNKGINEWLNLVRVQDYAKNKVYFLFSRDLSGVDEASARRNYFDLMFSVTARELGCRLEDMGVTQVFSAGRAPSAPFMYPSISKDIVKNVLSDFDYSDDYSDIASYETLSDQIAMDAFSHMKASLQQEMGSYNMSRPAMENAPGKIYMPCGLKAAVDLEIDALLESGGWLARCKRCGRYYVRDSEYTEEYCSLPGSGKTCLEIYQAEHPRSAVTPELERQCGEIMDEMYERVTAGALSLKEYEGWRLYLEAMKTKVNNGEIQPDDLSAFITYSRTMDISRSNPVVEVRRPATEPHERVVKPFVPERISRSDIDRPQERVQEPEPVQEPPQRREGFFTSPSVERQKSQGKALSHIIRADQSRQEPRPYPAPLPEPVPAFQNSGFAAFGEEAVQPRHREESVSAVPERGSAKFSESSTKPRLREEPARVVPDSGFTPFGANSQLHSPAEPAVLPGREPAPAVPYSPVSRKEVHYNAPEAEESAMANPVPVPEDHAVRSEEPAASQEVPATKQTEEPRPAPRIIRKNAAAISAYGKIAGTATRTEPSFDAITRPEVQPAPDGQPEPEMSDDPFWEIGSIFDMLEQSENDMSGGQRYSAVPESEKPEPQKKQEPEPAAEHPAPKRHKAPAKRHEPERATAPEKQEPSEVPSGIWTEERHLYDEQQQSAHEELNMLKDKKRRSSKTQRLFDAIMKEPDDNPNFRKK